MSNLPKISLLTLEYPPDCGGVARYYGEIVKRWRGEISVLRPRFWWLWPRWLPFIWQVGRLIRKAKIEMLWVGQVLPIGYAAWWLKKRKKIPYAVFTHGMDILVPQKSWWKKMWLKKILGEADLVVTNSEFTRNEVVKLGVRFEKTLVVYPCGKWNQADSFICRDAIHRVLTGQKVILSVGRLVKRKGFDKVIEVLPRVLKRIPQAKYVIIGQGPDISYLLSLISSLNLEDKVFILTQISDDELKDWYQKCDIFAMPCRQIGGDVEGFGMVFLEAASFGKPVVVGRSGGAPETVHHGYGGFVVDPESPEELYQALVRLLTDEAFARRMGEYGREWVAKKFRWEAEAGKLREKIVET